MLLLLGIILAIAWVLGFGVYHVGSSAIHMLMVLALVMVIMHVIRRVGPRAV
jgi:hypothetical protein